MFNKQYVSSLQIDRLRMEKTRVKQIGEKCRQQVGIGSKKA